MTKSCLDPDEWASVHKEIMEWKQEIDDTDQILSKSKNTADTSNFYPEVRRPVKKCENEEKKDKVEKKKGTATDYSQWDKFDADKECLKLDLEEEKKAEEKQRRELVEKKKEEVESKLSLEEKEIELISETAASLSVEERKVLAVKEKELGNEYYKGNLFNEALKHYTRSIYLHPTATSYNNRAATYLKQCRFSKAQEDLDIVLDLEPENVKAHFRRALTLQHKNEFEKALDDILFVLKRQPNHVIAKHIANELRENCCKLPKTHRLRTIDEKDPKKIVYIEVSDEEFKQKYKDKKNFVEVNEFNLPKVMCNCNGKHTNDPQMCSNDPLRYQQIRTRYGQKANEKIAEMEMANRMLKAAGNRLNNRTRNRESFGQPKPLVQPTDNIENKPTVSGARRLDIVELEKIEEEEMTSKIQGTHLNTMKGSSITEESKPKVITSCLVTDRRTIKTPKVYFGNYQEEDSEEGKQEEAAALITDMEMGDHIPKTKEEKMNLNINIKEALDIGGGGDAPMDEEMIVDESPLPSKSVTFSGPPPLSSICGSTAIKLNGMLSEESTLSEPMIDDEQPQQHKEDLPFKGPKNDRDYLAKKVLLKESTSSELMTNDERPQVVTVVEEDLPSTVSKEEMESLAKEVFPNETLRQCECGEGFQLWSSQFESKWLSFEKLPNVIEERSKLIRLVCPHRLSSVMSNTLNVELLSGFIDCLSENFDPVVEGDKVRSYLMSIANLQRFKIIYLFLSKESRENVNTLLEKFGPISPALKEAFL